MFLGVTEIIYPEQKEIYLASCRDRLIKGQILEQFKKDGFYLMDLMNIPKCFYKDSELCAAEKLAESLEGLIEKNTPVVLIKVNVYDSAFQILKEKGFNVIDKRIPFPPTGNQVKFRDDFTQVLKDIFKDN